MRRPAACLALVLVAGCGFAVADLSTVPPGPTWEADVQSFVGDHCLVCHGPKPDRGARDYFRLDVYADTDGKLGAYSMRERILERAVVRGNMPPGTSLGPNGKEMLRLWVWQGAPER